MAEDAPFKLPAWVIGAVAVLVIGLLVVGGLAIQRSTADGKAKQQQEQQTNEHNANVQFYSDQCMSGGRWIC